MHDWEYDYLEEPGIVLVDDFTRKYTDRDSRGDYEGSQLILTRKGLLIELTRQGEWSQWQGEGCHWGSTQKDLTLPETVREYSFGEIMKGFANAFKEAVKEAGKKQEDLTARQERLEEIGQRLAEMAGGNG